MSKNQSTRGPLVRLAALLVERARSPGARRFFALAFTAFVAVLIITETPTGPYLEKHLYVSPLFRLKRALGLQPRLHPELRAVMADDGSLKQLGRTPTFAEWSVIADRLMALGFERVLLQEPQDLAEQIGDPPPRRGGGALVAALVDAAGSKSMRLTPTAALPSRFGFAQAGARLCASSPESRAALAPAGRALERVDALGTVNVDLYTSFKVPLGICDVNGRLFPYLGLLAARRVEVKDEAIWLEDRPVPASADGSLWVDFVQLSSVLDYAVPVKAFYGSAGELNDELSSVALEKLKGGRIAVLLPGAYTGSRYTESPADGLVPAYVTLLSVATSALSGRFLVQPAPPFWIIGGTAIALVILLTVVRSAWLAVALALFLAVAFASAATALFFVDGWVLPTAAVGLLCTLLAGVRFADHFRRSMHDMGRLAHELEVGQTVQRMLLPQRLEGRVGPWQYRIVFRPHGAMAGDWFQIYQRGDDFAAIATGDVLGKGASAALITATIASVWKSESRRWDEGDFDAARLLSSLNASIKDVFGGEQHTTLSLAVLRPEAIQLFAIAAPAWVQLTPGRKGRTLPIGPSNPLGMAEPSREWSSRTLTPTDCEAFVSYTDGVLESTLSLMRFCTDAVLLDYDEADGLFGAVTQICEHFSNGNYLADDFTLCMIRFRQPAVLAEDQTEPFSA